MRMELGRKTAFLGSLFISLLMAPATFAQQSQAAALESPLSPEVLKNLEFDDFMPGIAADLHAGFRAGAQNYPATIGYSKLGRRVIFVELYFVVPYESWMFIPHYDDSFVLNEGDSRLPPVYLVLQGTFRPDGTSMLGVGYYVSETPPVTEALRETLIQLPILTKQAREAAKKAALRGQETDEKATKLPELAVAKEKTEVKPANPKTVEPMKKTVEPVKKTVEQADRTTVRKSEIPSLDASKSKSKGAVKAPPKTGTLLAVRTGAKAGPSVTASKASAKELQNTQTRQTPSIGQKASSSTGSPSGATIEYKGRLTDIVNKRPLVGERVSITINGKTYETKTKADGSYVLPAPKGATEVVVGKQEDKKRIRLDPKNPGVVPELKTIPAAYGKDRVVFILTWHTLQRDLDSVLSVSGQSEIVSFDHRRASRYSALLDKDDLKMPNGRESTFVSLADAKRSTLYFGVSKFDPEPSATLAQDRATVEIYVDGKLEAAVTAPAGSARHWAVAKVVNGQVQVYNRLLSSDYDRFDILDGQGGGGRGQKQYPPAEAAARKQILDERSRQHLKTPKDVMLKLLKERGIVSQEISSQQGGGIQNRFPQW